MLEMTKAVIGNKWWVHFKAAIWSFAADYIKRLNQDRLAEQTVQGSRVERP